MVKRIRLSKDSSRTIKRISKDLANLTHNKLVIFVLAFALIGSITLIATHAASPNVSLEPETSSSITAPAVAGSDSTASGGGYVQFKKAGTGDSGGTFFGVRVLPGWPTPSTTGTQIASYDAAHTLTNDGTNCKTMAGGTCPAAIKWTSVRGFVPNGCGTIDGYKFAGFWENAHNSAQHGDFSNPCTVIKNSLITGGVGVATGTTTCLFDASESSSPANVCGPLSVTDTSIIPPNDASSGNGSLFGDLNWQCIHCVGLYGRTMFNCQGWCDLEDTFALSGFLNNGQHMGTISDVGNTSGDPSTIAPFYTVKHSVMLCRTTNLDVGIPNPPDGGCTGDLNYVVHGCAGSAFNENPTPLILRFDGNLFGVDAGGNDGSNMVTFGDQCLIFTNAQVTNNVWEIKRSGQTYINREVDNNGVNKWCNNKTETGVDVGTSDFNCP